MRQALQILAVEDEKAVAQILAVVLGGPMARVIRAADGWEADVYAKGAQSDPVVPANGEKGVLRGGSWDYSAVKAKSTTRLAFDRAAGDVATGARCARTVEP